MYVYYNSTLTSAMIKIKNLQKDITITVNVFILVFWKEWSCNFISLERISTFMLGYKFSKVKSAIKK